jgi:hypothetical protein
MDPDRELEDAHRRLERNRRIIAEAARRRQAAEEAGPPSPMALSRPEYERVRDWLHDQVDQYAEQPDYNHWLMVEILDALRKIDDKLARLLERSK